ncbi:RES family NAD+ phosphorylase [Coraliomargarita sp. SDUM461003]|uniref:RES family NAD+ phosphorylase n=1 Tax=Thalassobacterium maritimum TaxID=3041265 RepID=A0ABU1AT66_9BACT|nr:RES family NAD+ phosphorylase [Coraliomargarita sp. SDUM461003]MDQ8207349.1 RES family NAD+ phosphorylase [Coraliomargarita sp. SDUM461003]
MVARKEYSDAPVFYGSGKSTRFSSPSAKYGVTYLARTKEAAFAETIRDSKLHYDANDNLCIYESELEQLELHSFKLKKGKARVIDLTGPGCDKIGARVECFTQGTAQGYRISQQWARELMTHPVAAAGLLYLGNRSADTCVALFGEIGKTGFENSIGNVEEMTIQRKTTPLGADGSFIRWLKEVDIQLTPSISTL